MGYECMYPIWKQMQLSILRLSTIFVIGRGFLSHGHLKRSTAHSVNSKSLLKNRERWQLEARPASKKARRSQGGQLSEKLFEYGASSRSLG